MRVHFRNNSESESPDFNSIWKIKGYKTILAYNLPKWINLEDGPEAFVDLNCSVQSCRLTTNHARERRRADLVLFHEHYIKSYHERPANQVYALYNIESPPHTARIRYPGAVKLLMYTSGELSLVLFCSVIIGRAYCYIFSILAVT